LILLPAGLVVRYLMRRAKRMRLAQALATSAAEWTFYRITRLDRIYM